MKGVTFPPRARGPVDEISIHTPVKGVTRSSKTRSPGSPYFNPHTREGCDAILQDPISGLTLFQSTHP